MKINKPTQTHELHPIDGDSHLPFETLASLSDDEHFEQLECAVIYENLIEWYIVFKQSFENL